MNSLVLFTKCLIIAEVISAIAAFATWKKWRGNYINWFPFYLSALILLEFLNYMFNYYHQKEIVSLVYQTSITIEILFVSYFFYKTLSLQKRSITIYGVIAFVIALLLEKTLLKNSSYYFQSLSYTIGTLFILIYLILFFTELVRSKNIFTFNKLTTFWVGLGMLIFYLGTFPFYGLYNELAKNLNLFMPVAWVATFLNYCMYLLFTIGFIWGKPH